MKIIKNKFKNLLIIEGQLHEDKRGYLREVYLKKLIKKKFKLLVNKKGIALRETYLPLHLHPVFKKNKSKKLPNCEQISKYSFDIPSGLKLKANQIKYIAKTIEKIASSLV